MSMLCRPMLPFLLMHGSHDIRHTGFPQVDGSQQDPREMGHHITKSCIPNIKMELWKNGGAEITLQKTLGLV